VRNDHFTDRNDETQPIHRLHSADNSTAWRVTSHALAREVLVDSRFSVRQQAPDQGDPHGQSAQQEALREHLRPFLESFGLVDPPDHTRVRRLLAAQFTVRRVNEQRKLIEGVVEDRLDAMMNAGPPIDLVKVFAAPVAVRSQSMFLGLPSRDCDRVRSFVTAADPGTETSEAVAAIQDFREFIEATIEHKRAEPGDDLISDVVTNDELTYDEVLSILFLLLGAGHDTTGSMLGLAVFLLLSEPRQLAAARAALPSVESTVEELLRYITVFPRSHPRTALEDVELDGQLVKAGEKVVVSLADANRDCAKFEDGDVLDLARSARGHIAFGHGVHMCLGQHLARLELQVGLAGLLQRFATLRLAVPTEDIRLRGDDAFTRRVLELPVAW
jgi:cytochrome P450